jgi:3-keto-5-aminohexanoate cleavage enzyme
LPGPAIIEVAINGSRSRASHPHVPLTADDVVRCIDGCVEAGASVVHFHAGQDVVGGSGRHDVDPYRLILSELRRRHPDLLAYPTLPGGGPGVRMGDRYAHLESLADAGLLDIAPVDPGTMNYGGCSADGEPPIDDRVYQTTFADVAYAFESIRRRELACTMSLFEPGFMQLVLAHRRAGTLPAASILKFEFSTGQRLMFGLPATMLSLQAWVAMLGGNPLPWMVTYRDGDVSAVLGDAALSLGGHIRVGIEDHAGPDACTNESLVATAAAIVRRHGRRPATPAEARRIIGVP